MWVLVMFDLPVKTKEDRRLYARFRNQLLAHGFLQLQYSVYARPCPSEENAVTHRNRVRSWIPPKGSVRMLSLTDKQFGRMEVYLGKKRLKAENQPEQLVFSLAFEDEPEPG
ncbi:MAG: CRISPR-associated endonuclease Cas2 [Fimbriimonadales bacterium]|nr:CRISPR-associated endonuclease Cas2 [Fimbriimonadales bacterium]